MSASPNDDVTTAIGGALPYLRRYARALTGSQDKGDAYAAATLEAVLADLEDFKTRGPVKVSLFQVFHKIWSTTGGALEEEADTLRRKAQQHLATLTNDTREALLLHTIEELPVEDVATVLSIATDEARSLIDIAYSEMSKSVVGKVMIIEDEAIIAMDLEAIVGDMGHQITGVARTETSALSLFETEKPDLILSDIQLADNSSGIDAVQKILEQSPDTPVIFITAYPERLLTGEGPEPAFLITKPFTEEQVRSAVSQAMFFSSTKTLQA